MKKQNMLAFMTAMQMANDVFNEETLKRPLNKKPKKKPIPKGLKEFFYGENSLYALNQKNADRKARKKGYL